MAIVNTVTKSSVTITAVGAELIAIQKNEPSAPTSVGLGAFDFESNSVVSSGNSFADFLTGRIASYAQTSAIVNITNRYKIFEPYFQDDCMSPNGYLKSGLRVSMFQTNRDKTRTL